MAGKVYDSMKQVIRRMELVQRIGELHEALIESFDDNAAVTIEDVVEALVNDIKQLKLLDLTPCADTPTVPCTCITDAWDGVHFKDCPNYVPPKQEVAKLCNCVSYYARTGEHHPNCPSYKATVGEPYIDRTCDNNDAFRAGFRVALHTWAYWKDGVQYVGSCGTTLKQALIDMDNEPAWLTRLKNLTPAEAENVEMTLKKLAEEKEDRNAVDKQTL